MDKELFRRATALLQDHKVKVTNAEYINGGYEGIIVGYRNDHYSGEKLLIQHPYGDDNWENIKDCEIIN